jgi:hypothetical protein
MSLSPLTHQSLIKHSNIMKLYDDPQTLQVLEESFDFLNDAKNYIHEYAFELVTLLEFQAMRNAIIKFNDMLPSEYQNAIAIEEFNPLINLNSESGMELFGDDEILELPKRTEAMSAYFQMVQESLQDLNA